MYFLINDFCIHTIYYIVYTYFTWIFYRIKRGLMDLNVLMVEAWLGIKGEIIALESENKN